MKLHTVLVPPQNIANVAENFATGHFGASNMGYCIGTNGHLPHITLIQTTVTDGFNVRALYQEIMALDWSPDTVITLADYYHRHEKPYNGLEMQDNDQVKQIHEAALAIHKAHDLEIESGHGDDFWPHLTFAKSEHRLVEPIKIPNELREPNNGWKLEFGYRGEHSVYLGPYTP